MPGFEKLILGAKMFDFRFGRSDLGNVRPAFWLERPDLGSERPDWGSERLHFGTEA